MEIAAERSLAEIGCDPEVAPVLVGCCWFTPPASWPVHEFLVPDAGGGFITAVGCIDVAEGRGSLTLMLCGSADATTPLTGSCVFEVSTGVATGSPPPL